MGRKLNVERIRRVVLAKEYYRKSFAEIALNEKISRERVRQIYNAYLIRCRGYLIRGLYDAIESIGYGKPHT